MDNKNPIQREQYFTEYFNLKKKQKEYKEKENIECFKKKQTRQKIKEYFKGESEDIEAIADNLASDRNNNFKKNIGFQLKYNQVAWDGVENDLSISAAENKKRSEQVPESAPEKETGGGAGKANAKQIASEAIKRIVLRTAAKFVLTMISSLASFICTALAPFIFIFWLIIIIYMMISDLISI